MPDPTRAAEPVPVPPPVDAILKLVDEFGEDMADSGMADGTGARETGTQCMLDAQQARDKIVAALGALWAAGVEEGRRQRDAEIRADVLASARLAAAEAGFGPAPESVTVSYETGPTAYEQGIYDAGIAEGRRQAGTGVLAEVVAERIRQDVKWGEQNHPDYYRGDDEGATQQEYASEADSWKHINAARVAEQNEAGTPKDRNAAWDGILLEEVFEALAECNPAKLRAELIQVAAVAVAWVQAIDRRSA